MCNILLKNFGCQIYSGYINQSLEVDEYFPLLTHTDEYEYRTDIFDDEELEEELQFRNYHNYHQWSDDDNDIVFDGDDDDEYSNYDDREDNDKDGDDVYISNSKSAMSKLDESFGLKPEQLYS